MRGVCLPRVTLRYDLQPHMHEHNRLNLNLSIVQQLEHLHLAFCLMHAVWLLSTFEVRTATC